MNKRMQATPDEADYKDALNDMGTYIDTTIDDLREVEERAKIFAKIREKKQIPVHQVMSAPAIIIHADRSLTDAALLICSKRVSTLPVVDSNNRLIGLVTESDFLEAIGIPAHHPSHTILHSIESIFTENPAVKSPVGQVKDIMQKQVYTTQESSLVKDAIDIMKKHKIRHLVVCDEEKSVKGILSQSNLIRLFFHYASTNV